MKEKKLGELLKTATEELKKEGIETARLDAELLACEVLGVERSYLYAHPEKVLSGEEVKKFFNLVERRKKHEPIAYITRKKEFLFFEFKVEKGVFIPRPETEILVLEVYRRIKGREGLKIVDVGTGSGAILVSLCKLLGEKNTYIGTDISFKALTVAKENAKRLNCKCHFVRTSILDGINFADVVVSNPPYVGRGEETDISVKFEPEEAIYGGEKGTEFIFKLVKEAGKVVKKGGLLAVEVGIKQWKEVVRMFKEEGFKNVEVVKDLAGIERVVLGWKSS